VPYARSTGASPLCALSIDCPRTRSAPAATTPPSTATSVASSDTCRADRSIVSSATLAISSHSWPRSSPSGSASNSSMKRSPARGARGAAGPPPRRSARDPRPTRRLRVRASLRRRRQVRRSRRPAAKPPHPGRPASSGTRGRAARRPGQDRVRGRRREVGRSPPRLLTPGTDGTQATKPKPKPKTKPRTAKNTNEHAVICRIPHLRPRGAEVALVSPPLS
jgi:hypothetical protein